MSRLQEFLANTSPVATSFSGILIATYLLQLVVPSIKSVLGLVPGKTILMPWMILTSGFVQESLITLTASTAALLLLSKPIEAVQGQGGYIRCILIALAGSGGLTFFVVTVVYYFLAASGHEDAGDVLYTPICGFQGGLAAIFVLLKQAIPDNDITVFSAVRFKVKDLPGVYCVVVTVIALFTFSSLHLLPFTFFATYISWFYLRFFAYRSDSFVRGDSSPDFSLSSFFPSQAHPFIDEISSVCSKVTGLDALMKSEAQQVQQNNALLLGRATPSRDTFEAHRRRERGARALEERLGMVKEGGAVERASSASSVTPLGLAAVLDSVESGNGVIAKNNDGNSDGVAEE